MSACIQEKLRAQGILRACPHCVDIAWRRMMTSLAGFTRKGEK